MNISGLILRIAGWKVHVTVPDYPKCIICVAPHTSNWDFILGKLAYASIGRKAGFLMKDSWFFFPLGYILKAIGGVSVARKSKAGSLVEQLIYRYNHTDRLTLAITPEGTRSLNQRWHTGFLNIAYATHVNVVLGAIDFGTKQIFLTKTFEPTGNIDDDMRAVKNYYKQFQGKYPEKFTAE